MLVPTVKIVRGADYVIINLADFNPAQDELFEPEPEPNDGTDALVMALTDTGNPTPKTKPRGRPRKTTV